MALFADDELTPPTDVTPPDVILTSTLCIGVVCDMLTIASCLVTSGSRTRNTAICVSAVTDSVVGNSLHPSAPAIATSGALRKARCAIESKADIDAQGRENLDE